MNEITMIFSILRLEHMVHHHLLIPGYRLSQINALSNLYKPIKLVDNTQTRVFNSIRVMKLFEYIHLMLV